MVMRAYLGLTALLGAGGMASRSLATSVPKSFTAADIHSRILNNSNVLVFSKTYCPYCTMAKEALTAYGVTLDVMELDTTPEGAAIQAELAKVTGQTTVCLCLCSMHVCIHVSQLFTLTNPLLPPPSIPAHTGT